MNVKIYLTVAQPTYFSSVFAGKWPAAFFEYIFRNTAAALPRVPHTPGRFASPPFPLLPSSGPPDTFAGPPAVAAVGPVLLSGWDYLPVVKPPSRSTGRGAACQPGDSVPAVSPVSVYLVRSETLPGFPDRSRPWFDNWHNPAGQRCEGSFPTPFPGQFHDPLPGVHVQAGPYPVKLGKFRVQWQIFPLILAVFGQFRFSCFCKSLIINWI